jgi:hypothetical protein
MGTNFYVRKGETSVHIGKSSAGWKFLFAPHPELYDQTRASINRYLKLNKENFYDEYGEKVDLEEFWEDIDWKKDGREESGDIITEEGLRFAKEDNFS